MFPNKKNKQSYNDPSLSKPIIKIINLHPLSLVSLMSGSHSGIWLQKTWIELFIEEYVAINVQEWTFHFLKYLFQRSIKSLKSSKFHSYKSNYLLQRNEILKCEIFTSSHLESKKPCSLGLNDPDSALWQLSKIMLPKACKVSCFLDWSQS